MIVLPVAADPVGAGLVDSLRGRARIGRFPEAKTVTADGSQPLLAGGSAKRPVSLRTGAEPRHHEHRSPGTSVPIDARGWRSTRRSIVLPVPPPGRTRRAMVRRRGSPRIMGNPKTLTFQTAMPRIARKLAPPEIDALASFLSFEMNPRAPQATATSVSVRPRPSL
jgi:hypothetical protein